MDYLTKIDKNIYSDQLLNYGSKKNNPFFRVFLSIIKQNIYSNLKKGEYFYVYYGE